MVPSVFLAFTFSIVLASCNGSTADVNNYSNLIVAVKEFHKITGVGIVYYNGFENSHVAMGLVRQLSRNFHYSMAVEGSELRTKFSQMKSSSKLLFVVMLKTEDDLKEFKQFTTAENIDSHTWLLLFDSSMDESLSDFCRNPQDNVLGLSFSVQMLVKCGDDSAIREWFCTGPTNKTQVHEYLEWSPTAGLIPKEIKNLFERRQDLRVTVKVAYTEHDTSYPLAERIKDGHKYELFPKVIDAFTSVMNMSLIYPQLSNNNETCNNESRSQTEVSVDLKNETVDVVVLEEAADNYGSDIDVTLPIVFSKNYFFIKMPSDGYIPGSIYFEIFSKRSWAAIITIIIMSTIVFTVISIKNGVKKAKWIVVLDDYMNVWGVYCQQGLNGVYPNNGLLKFLHLLVLISAFLCTSMYIGSLASYITVSLPTMPFEDLPEFVQDGTYKIISTKHTAHYRQLLESADDQTLREVTPYIKNLDDMPESYVAGFEQVCNEKSVYYGSISTLEKNYHNMPCEVKSIPLDIRHSESIGLRKNHPLTEFFNHYIRKFNEHGIMERLKFNYKIKHNEKDLVMNYIELEDVTAIIFVLFCGCILSGIVLLFEVIYHWFHKQNKRDLIMRFYNAGQACGNRIIRTFRRNQ